jgi:hypothetical protein
MKAVEQVIFSGKEKQLMGTEQYIVREVSKGTSMNNGRTVTAVNLYVHEV